MFPYASAEGLHVGNMYAFTGADIYGRFQRMQGYDVFEPIGLDGFGIHSENYAIKVGRHPIEHAKISEKHFYEQLHQIGAGFAWDNKLETYDPAYYRWTQWLFIQMYKHDLAYRKTAQVNWCPSCKTVLSDEQVEGGVCERCKSLVSRKEMEQWFFKITEFADRLLDNIPQLKWPKKITIAQQNWIGKKEGINIQYPIKDSNEVVTCFTTVPVNFGMTFIVVSPEHQLVNKVLNGELKVPAEKIEAIKKYVEEAKHKSEQQRKVTEKEKTGVFTGLYAHNHVANWDVPVWVADFVLKDVGTGAVQGCPGHDYKDFEFARKHGLPIKRVIVGPNGDTSEIDSIEKVIAHGMPGTMINSGFLNGMKFAEALQKTMDYIEEKGNGKRVITYHLRDWLISRQRYWGPPIPMIQCKDCGWQPVPEDQLPVLLPYVKDFQPIGEGKTPLEKAPKEWLEVKCPKCGNMAKRATEVSDTFLDSAWYFLAYPNLKTDEWNHSAIQPFNHSVTSKWLPVHAYIGGAEHAVLHLLYARFVWMCLKDWGYLPGIKSDEPFPFLFSHGLIIKDGAKMSKSRGNVVNPDEYITRYGADTLRMYLMFVGPYDNGGDFRDSGMAGMYRFLERIWRMFQKQGKGKTNSELQQLLNRTIKRVTEDYSKFKFNTVISSLMIFMNALEEKAKEERRLSKDDTVSFLRLLAPIAPHITDELYHLLEPSGKNSIHQTSWPSVDREMLSEETVSIPIQVNGKTRTILTVPALISRNEEKVLELAQAEPKVRKYIENATIRKQIFIPGKTMNFVI